MTLPIRTRDVLGPDRRLVELVAPAAATAAIAALLLAFGPAPGDAAVHLYRTFLVRSGNFVWDNFWYEGDAPLANYSLLYYVPAALVGNIVLVFSACVTSTYLFGSIARREWGNAAAWPARVFGICAAAPLFTGLYSYSLGFAAMLGTIRALQARRTWLAVVLAALTLGFAPLAFAFLCLVLASVLVARRHLSRPGIVIGVAIAVLAGLQLAVLQLFPSKGFYPFHDVNLAAVLGVCALGWLVARRADNARVLSAFFVLWAAGSVGAAIIHSPVGDNWTRLNEYALPVMLLTAALARFRPRKLVLLALAGALAYNIVPYLLLIPYRLDNRPASASFWTPALTYLRANQQPGYRVEVVPTAAHWESYWLAKDGFALARGWYRQLDTIDNPVLYRKNLGAAAYRQWLRQVAVEYVLLPATRLDFVAAPAEAKLLRSGRSGLKVVFRSANWTIYRLPDATPLLTGPGRARVSTFSHTTIAGTISKPGTYLLRTHFVPFWNVRGEICVSRAPGRMTYVQATQAGPFSLKVASPGDAIVDAATGGHHCKARTVAATTATHG